MKLYYAPGACSMAPHIAACEAGISLGLEKVDLPKRLTETGVDFNQINPKGYIPVLELDNGERLTEATVILQYLADQKPDSGLIPGPHSFERYRLQEWLTFISSELHKTFSPLFSPATVAETRTSLLERIGVRFTWLSGVLDSKPYLMGEAFSVADAYLFTVLGWARFVKLDLGPWPVLVAYQARIAGRPGVQQALREEGLLK